MELWIPGNSFIDLLGMFQENPRISQEISAIFIEDALYSLNTLFIPPLPYKWGFEYKEVHS